MVFIIVFIWIYFLSLLIELSMTIFCLLSWGMNMMEQNQTTEATSFIGFRDMDVRLFGKQNLLRHRVNLTSHRMYNYLLSRTLKNDFSD